MGVMSDALHHRQSSGAGPHRLYHTTSTTTPGSGSWSLQAAGRPCKAMSSSLAWS